MSISEAIESKYWNDLEFGHHQARIDSSSYFIRLVEDLSYSEVIDFYYNTDDETLNFGLADYDKTLRINIRMDSLKACTNDIVRQTYSYLARNDRY